MTRVRKGPMDEENLGSMIITGLKEAIAFEQGEITARVRVRGMRSGHAKVQLPPTYDAERVRAVRVKLAMSQNVFAQALNVSDKTMKAWEQGLRPPSGPTQRLLELAEEHPEAFLAKVSA
ncbi:MAG: helix-turn-helix domain-containing protein [Thermomicrobiales bacterium]